ncbi:cytochrome P450 [Gonapodya prolifera JEL478]|uniref:Cytochrome P450 n=1 Tax=Gonapodya prolifera (strain JEL478) TaxID=1344416 RepID=A0A139ASZ1_GONPJ|nr:cytochrome P450 [Gonapodya prolifera JEL478]|eukprot:KXS19848.1 cytochrome P450 [Gonapodya prolifera JEL478]
MADREPQLVCQPRALKSAARARISQRHVVCGVQGVSELVGACRNSATPLWIAWQRWNGKLSLTADALLTQYGPVVCISPSMVLVNDGPTVASIFAQRHLDAPKAVRALLTYLQNRISCERRDPVMIATTTKNLKYWRPTFEKNINAMVHDLARTGGTKAEDIVRHLGICTLKNSQVILGGYNFLVIWRMCMPEWLFTWLEHTPFTKPRFRVQWSDLLFDLGAELYRHAKAASKDVVDDAPNVYQRFTESKAGGPRHRTGRRTRSAPKWPVRSSRRPKRLRPRSRSSYTSSRTPNSCRALHKELNTVEGTNVLETLPFLDACIRKDLRFQPPVALTGSRLVPQGGMDGTVLTMQSLSMSRQRPDLFPHAEEYDATRWIGADVLAERRALLVAFGVGARRCPGGNMAVDQMRLLLAALTTPEIMAPFEANGYRSRHDACHLFFTPRPWLHWVKKREQHNVLQPRLHLGFAAAAALGYEAPTILCYAAGPA